MRYVEREASGLSVLLMRVLQRAALESGLVPAFEALAPAAKALAPLQRLQASATGAMPLYSHCLCSPE